MSRQRVLLYRLNSFIRIFAVITGLLVILGFSASPASASQPNLPGGGNYTSIAAAPNGGFWAQVHGDSGGQTRTIAIDGAPAYESVNEVGSIAAIPGKNGYWVVTTGGNIHARGEAPQLCGGRLQNCSGFSTGNGKHITAAAASPNGQGLWAVDSARHVWTAGNVVSYGDVTSDNRVPTGIAATPSGQGYYIVMDDGGVHARGDAVFYGSTGGNRPGGHDLVGIALSQDLAGEVDGYWLVGSDGGVHTFGNATFLGSSGGGPGRGAISGIVARPDGRSYAWVWKDGGVSKSQDSPPIVIKSPRDGNVIGVPNGSTEISADLKMETPNGSNAQKWKVVRAFAPDRSVLQLINVNSNFCMDLEFAHVSAGIIQHPCKPDGDNTNQLWNAVKVGSNWEFQSVEHKDYRLYGYPAEYGGGLIVSYYTNSGLDWNAIPTP